MASTQPDIAVKPAATKKPAAHNDTPETQENLLTAEVSKFYGVEFDGKDYDKFIKECTEAGQSMANAYERGDPVQQALMDEKLGKLRQLVAAKDEGKNEPANAADIRNALEDAGYTVGITFPDDKTWAMNVGGKEDTGSLEQPVEAIVAAAGRLTGNQAQ